MINLIPNEEKKKKVKDFYFRLGVVTLAMFGTVMFVATFAITPAFVLSVVRKNTAENKLAEETNKPIPKLDEDTLAAVRNLQTELDLLEKVRGSAYLVSEKVIDEVIANKMADIRLTEITYENLSGAERKISIRGIAPSRERLLLFRRSLEDDPMFKNVDLPISNFVKGSNIQFYLTLIPS